MSFRHEDYVDWLLLLSYYNSNAIVEKAINFIKETFERLYSRQIWTVHSILSSPHKNIFTTNFKKVKKIKSLRWYTKCLTLTQSNFLYSPS